MDKTIELKDIIKELDDIKQLLSAKKVKQQEYNAEYVKKHKEHTNKYAKNYYKENREKVLQQAKERYRINHPKKKYNIYELMTNID